MLYHHHLKYFYYSVLCFAAIALANGTWDTVTYCAAILYWAFNCTSVDCIMHCEYFMILKIGFEHYYNSLKRVLYLLDNLHKDLKVDFNDYHNLHRTSCPTGMTTC